MTLLGPTTTVPSMTDFARPAGLEHGSIAANGIEIHYESIGSGPLVILCHGWPESWYSWRHQLPVVADAGFRAVAPHIRGYGDTTAPQDVDKYMITDLIGDGSAWSTDSERTRPWSSAMTGVRLSRGTRR